MNPLSPFTYYKRHKGRILLLVAIIALATMGLFLMVGVLDTIPLRANANYLNYVSRVYPKASNDLEPGVVSQLQIDQDVDRVVSETGLNINYPVLVGNESLRLLGISVEDANYLMEHSGLRLKEGRLFEPRTNEIVLTDEVARALDLQIGDKLGRSIDKSAYYSLVTELTLVGILERDPNVVLEKDITPRYGFLSGEYLDSHEAYIPRQHNLIIVPAEGRLDALNVFLEDTIRSDTTGVETINDLMTYVRLARQALYVIFGLVNVLVAVVIALVIATINRIALMERIEELGALNALGFDRNFLTRRMIMETAVISGIGWLLGVILSLAVLIFLKGSFFYNLGTDVNLWNPAPFFFIVPMPLAIIFSAMISIRKVFANFDAVQILERGKLSTESREKQQSNVQSAIKPLSSLTFYRRHRGRGYAIVITMSIMILGVAFPAFLMLTGVNAMKPEIESLRHISEVYPVQAQAVDTGITASIRTHPGVDRVIPIKTLGVQMQVPPGGATTVTLYGVSEDELPLLIEHLGVHLLEGHLPHPRTNEMVISESIAANRGLAIGDVIGGPSDNEAGLLLTDNIPVEMVVTGILGPDVPWVGLASYEFLTSHELTRDSSEGLLVLLTTGQESEVNTWLQEEVSNDYTEVNTYEVEIEDYREFNLGITVVFALVESMIAVVAAVALATLNFIFFSQRKDEFGILNALGHSRRWLTLRTMQETGSVVFLAWLIGAIICMLGLVLAQQFIYSPLGLRAEIGNLTPWLFTLPIPIAVVLASTGTIYRMLRKLDPVTIIEQR